MLSLVLFLLLKACLYLFEGMNEEMIRKIHKDDILAVDCCGLTVTLTLQLLKPQTCTYLQFE